MTAFIKVPLPQRGGQRHAYLRTQRASVANSTWCSDALTRLASAKYCSGVGLRPASLSIVSPPQIETQGKSEFVSKRSRFLRDACASSLSAEVHKYPYKAAVTLKMNATSPCHAWYPCKTFAGCLNMTLLSRLSNARNGCAARGADRLGWTKNCTVDERSETCREPLEKIRGCTRHSVILNVKG